MNREEILKRIREENRENEPYEAEVSQRSWKLGAIVAACVAAVVFLLEAIIWDKYNFGIFFTLLLIPTVSFLFQAIRLREKSRILLACLYLVIFLCFFVVYTVAFIRGIV